MTKWKYKLGFEGKTLRSLVRKEEETIENIIAIYNQIIVCLKSWKKRLHESDKENWEYDIELMIEDLQSDCPNVEENNGYDEERDQINYYLRCFYDMCDDARVWIGM